jgi:hypothetical protein
MPPLDRQGDKEHWKQISGSAAYEVSSLGNVRHSGSGKLKTLTLARSGYYVVNLYAFGITNVRAVHSVVAGAFIGPVPDGHAVVHLDGNPLNNRAGNLSYMRRGEALRFIAHAAGVDLISRRNKPELTLDQILEITDRASRGEQTIKLAIEFGVSAPTISRLKRGWRQ